MITSRNTDTLIARLRFRQLQLLETVAATGSLRAAAQALHQTQPALSKSLREVEDMLGFPLFERTPRGLRASAQGRIVVRGASLLIAELRNIHDEARVSQGRAEAVLRLGVPPFIALSLLPSVLSHLLRREPPVLVRLTEQPVPQLHELLLAGELDALLTTYSSEPVAITGAQRLRYEKLFDGEIVVVAPAGWRSPGVARWKQLAAERWILPDRASLIRRLADEMFLRDGCKSPEPVVESTSPLTNVSLVSAGLGLAMVPASTAKEAERAGKLKRVNVRPAIPTAPVALVYRAELSSHPRITLLRQAIGT